MYAKNTWTTKDKATVLNDHSEAVTIAKILDAKVYDSEKGVICRVQASKRKKEHSQKRSQVQISVKNCDIEKLGGKLEVALLAEKYISSLVRDGFSDNRTVANDFPIGQTPLILE